MPRQRSDLYQVDFMAALFGGFVLVWLSGQGILETPTEGQKSPVFFSLSARLIYSKAGEREVSVPVLPEEALDAPCISPDWLKPIFGSRPKPDVCHASSSVDLPPGGYDELVKKAAREDPKPHEFVRLAGINLRLSEGASDENRDPVTIGRVVTNIGSNTRGGAEHPEIARNLQQILIAIVPSRWKSVPRFAVRDASTIQTLLFSETARGKGAVEYRFPNINDSVAYIDPRTAQQSSAPPERLSAQRLEVVMHWDLAGRNLCYHRTVEVKDTKGADRAYDLLPCASAADATGSPL
jgi:hypothetical protein